MRIKITADSTCDPSEELLAQWDIALMPMHILMGEDSYLDGVTIHPADVFAYVNAGGKMPKSAAANLVEYTEFFEPFAKECDAVIHISSAGNHDHIIFSQNFQRLKSAFCNFPCLMIQKGHIQIKTDDPFSYSVHFLCPFLSFPVLSQFYPAMYFIKNIFFRKNTFQNEKYMLYYNSSFDTEYGVAW